MAEKEKQTRKRVKKSELTTQEVAYVCAYTEIGTKTCGHQGKSAIKAGICEAEADRWASRLMRADRVREAIAEIHRKMMDRALINPQKILSDLENNKALALAKGDIAAANRAVELQGKYLTMFGDRFAIEQDEEQRELSESQKEQAKLIAQQIVLNQNRPHLATGTDDSTETE